MRSYRKDSILLTRIRFLFVMDVMHCYDARFRCDHQHNESDDDDCVNVDVIFGVFVCVSVCANASC